VTVKKDRLKRVIVIYDTKYGNTAKIAKTLELGIREAGIQTFCANARDIVPESLKEYDLIAIGSPTQKLTASKPMKAFLQGLKNTNLKGKLGFAFDTKLDSRLSGSAAKYIENAMKKLEFEIFAPRASARVRGLGEKEGGAELKELEETLFHHIGVQIGSTLAAREKGIPA